MKILTLNYEYPPVGGGGGRLCRAVAEELVARGHRVRVVTAGVGRLPRRETVGGVEILRPPTLRRREDTCSVVEMGLYLAGALPCALGQARRWKPDVMHAHFVVPTGLLALVLHRATRRPYVVTAHLGDVPGGVPEQTAGIFRLAGPAARAVWAAAAARTAVSGHVATLAENAFGTRPATILNGIPPVPEAPPRTPGPPLRLLVAGRLSTQKNPLLAIAALEKLAHLDWRLTVAGAGPLLPGIRDAAGRAGIAGKIQFRGWTTSEDLAVEMAKSDVLLMTSHGEGLPMVAVEALWRGMAIVGTRVGGMCDVVADGANGFLCAPTADDLAAAIARLEREPETLAAFQRHSRQIAQNFDILKTAGLYEEVLAAAAAGAPA